MDKKPPADILKPDTVKIIDHSVAMIPTALGQPALLITGLGDNGVIYKYESKKKEWRTEASSE